MCTLDRGKQVEEAETCKNEIGKPSPKRMNVRRIEVFLAVVGAGSFTAAADRLHIVQSAVSAAVRDLEEELGVPLLIRNKRPLQLTPAGRLLFARATPALQELESVRREIQELRAQNGVRLKVAATPLITQVELAPIFASFLLQHPNVRLVLMQVGSLEVEDLLLKEEVDLGILAVRAVHPDLRTRYLWNVTSTPCLPAKWTVPSKKSISWGELLAHPMAVFPRGYHLREVCEQHAERTGSHLSIAIETSSVSLILEAIRSGVAASILPDEAVACEPSISRISLVQKSAAELGLIGCWRRAEPLSQICRSLLDFLGSRRTSTRRRSV